MKGVVLAHNHQFGVWEVVTADHYQQYRDAYERPLEVVPEKAKKDINALHFMADQMNIKPESAAFWIRHAKTYSDNGRRVTYARMLLELDPEASQVGSTLIGSQQ